MGLNLGNVTHNVPYVSAIIRTCFKRSLIFVSPILDSMSFLISIFGQNPITGATSWQKRRRIGKHVCEDGVAEGSSLKWLLPSSAVLLSPASRDRKLHPLCSSSSSSASSAFKIKILQSNVPLLQKEVQGAPEERAVQEGLIPGGDVNMHTILQE